MHKKIASQEAIFLSDNQLRSFQNVSSASALSSQNWHQHALLLTVYLFHNTDENCCVRFALSFSTR
ncbi:hypothetical protein AL522_18660 [Pantoea vagans]|nr:hypothetical protein AL522_18660 [Pantoea vagans]